MPSFRQFVRGLITAYAAGSCLAAFGIVVVMLHSCASALSGLYIPPSEAERNPLKAQELTLEAADLIDTDPAQAEKLLREALDHDLLALQGFVWVTPTVMALR